MAAVVSVGSRISGEHTAPSDRGCMRSTKESDVMQAEGDGRRTRVDGFEVRYCSGFECASDGKTVKYIGKTSGKF